MWAWHGGLHRFCARRQTQLGRLSLLISRPAQSPGSLPVIFMTLRYLTILSFLLFSFNNVLSGQTSSDHLDTLINDYINELKANNIDTVCIYQDYCVGCSHVWRKEEDRCNYQGLFVSTYIFWIDKGQTFITKKDNCFDYSTDRISSDSLWTFFFLHKDTIEKEEIKIPQYVEVKDGKKEVYSSTIDHSYHQTIRIIVRQKTLIDKEIDDYYLTQHVGFNGQENINYNYNINSYIKTLQLLIDRTIKKATLTKTRR